ncbi:ubiquitin carboxyl-terminal hydrolase 37-like [Asterias rubens]|uniref:ubiquitin carboxyl-terminal hydrolase 37-like n=1 Tax=Asterias rubens TaxID=7604 RepID=UPI001455541C|nr:ubiquitin carboxyl-terminal hydrolase 37-like [Asterias rubens]XP_033632892.1 ubiquitin carboxyl-terminal hydrolase 37-like [Asterias rubens]
MLLRPFLTDDTALAQLLCAKQSNHSAESIGVYLRKVKQAISTTAARFSGFMQHDAQEFLCQCLDQLKDDTERANKRALNSPLDETPGTDDDKIKLRFRYPHDCPIVKNFEFEVMHSTISRWTCPEGVILTRSGRSRRRWSSSSERRV